MSVADAKTFDPLKQDLSGSECEESVTPEPRATLYPLTAGNRLIENGTCLLLRWNPNQSPCRK